MVAGLSPRLGFVKIIVLLIGLAARAGAQAGPWTTHPIASSGGGNAIDSADVDGDGAPDVVSGVVWCRNLGSGTGWTTYSSGLAAADHAGDLDGDGDTDFLGIGGSASLELAWAENVSGDGTAIVQHRIAASAPFSYPETDAADLDGDGDLDALQVFRLDWHENVHGDGSVWLAHPVSSATGLQSVDVADVDGDGDQDVFTGSDVDYSWHENASGDGASWVSHAIIGRASYEDRDVRAADVDGDGAVDAVFSSSAVFAGPFALGWLRNADGRGTTWSPRIVTSSSLASPDFGVLIGSDVDRDGDTDLLKFSPGITVWYEQDRGTWRGHGIPNYWGIGTVIDVDQDGDRDLFGSGGYIQWSENLTRRFRPVR